LALKELKYKCNIDINIQYQTSIWKNKGIELIKKFKFDRYINNISKTKLSLYLPKLVEQNKSYDLIFVSSWIPSESMVADFYYIIELLNNKKSNEILFSDSIFSSKTRINKLLYVYSNLKEKENIKLSNLKIIKKINLGHGNINEI